MIEMHVLPLGDLIEHEKTDECICGPDVAFLGDGRMMVEHHSLDGREAEEE